MKIGILKEQSPENRVAILPEGVTSFNALKVDVIVEKSAGESAFVSDKQYEEAGAEVASKSDVLKKADLIVKVNPFDTKDIKTIGEGKVILAAMNPYFNKDLVKQIADAKLTSFSMELVPRITRAQSMDILSSMATVSGYKAVLDAAHNLPRFFPMFMTAAGTIKPAKLLILGAGVAGLQAIATSRKLGAVVHVFDVRSAVKEEVMSLGGKFVEVEGATEDKDAGGYAVEQTEDFKKKQAQVIHDHAVASDVIICTAQIPGKKAPLLIKKETVDGMRAGSIVIDLAASTGGNCELTKNEETVVHNAVKIIGNSQYPSETPYDASSMFGKNILNFLKLVIDEEGNLNLNFEDEIVDGTCLTHNGQVHHAKVKEVLNL